ncbi:MAG: hypothetical protein ACR2N6_09610 [Miltoncostaeaceae bacterium]
MGLLDRLLGRDDRSARLPEGSNWRTAWNRRLRASWGGILYEADDEDWHALEPKGEIPSDGTDAPEGLVVFNAGLYRDFRFLERAYTVAAAPARVGTPERSGPSDHPEVGETVTTCVEGWLMVWRRQSLKKEDPLAPAPVRELRAALHDL